MSLIPGWRVPPAPGQQQGAAPQGAANLLLWSHNATERRAEMLKGRPKKNKITTQKPHRNICIAQYLAHALETSSLLLRELPVLSAMPTSSKPPSVSRRALWQGEKCPSTCSEGARLAPGTQEASSSSSSEVFGLPQGRDGSVPPLGASWCLGAGGLSRAMAKCLPCSPAGTGLAQRRLLLLPSPPRK